VRLYPTILTPHILQVLILDLYCQYGSLISSPFQALLLFLQHYSTIDLKAAVINIGDQDDSLKSPNINRLSIRISALLQEYRLRYQSCTEQEINNGEFETHFMNAVDPFSSQVNLCQHVTQDDASIFQAACQCGLETVLSHLENLKGFLNRENDPIHVKDFLMKCFGKMKNLSLDQQSKITMIHDLNHFEKLLTDPTSARQILTPSKILLNQCEFFLKQLRVFISVSLSNHQL
jgi:hypothetical protein